MFKGFEDVDYTVAYTLLHTFAVAMSGSPCSINCTSLMLN